VVSSNWQFTKETKKGDFCAIDSFSSNKQEV
jgi:hypothetical protein